MLIWNRSKFHGIIYVLWACCPLGPSAGLFAEFKHTDNKILHFSRVIHSLSKTRKGQPPAPKTWAACNNFWINLFWVWTEWGHAPLTEVTCLTEDGHFLSIPGVPGHSHPSPPSPGHVINWGCGSNLATDLDFIDHYGFQFHYNWVATKWNYNLEMKQ